MLVTRLRSAALLQPAVEINQFIFCRAGGGWCRWLVVAASHLQCHYGDKFPKLSPIITIIPTTTTVPPHCTAPHPPPAPANMMHKHNWQCSSVETNLFFERIRISNLIRNPENFRIRIRILFVVRKFSNPNPNIRDSGKKIRIRIRI